MTSINKAGSFLVRQNKKTGVFSLAINDETKARQHHIQRHKDGTFYILQKCSFKSIHNLVTHHSDNADGLCRKLVRPCMAPNLIRDENDVSVAEKLVTGQFYEVWKGEWNGETVAVHVIKPSAVSQFNLLDQCALLTTMSHQNLVRFRAIFINSEPFRVITEHMVNRSLKEYLPSREKELKMADLIQISAQVASGMCYLEKMSCIHHDLAAKNVLVKENHGAETTITCKLSIYPYVNKVDSTGGVYSLTAGTVPIRWLPHQDIVNKQVSINSNVWSFGVFVWEILNHCRNYPYPEMSELGVLEKLKQGYRMPRPLGCPGELHVLWTLLPTNSRARYRIDSIHVCFLHRAIRQTTK